MIHARTKLLQAKVNSLLSSCDFNTPLDGLLLHSQTLRILSYEPNEASPREGPKAVRGDSPEQTGARPGGPVPSPKLPATGPVDQPPLRQFRRRPKLPANDRQGVLKGFPVGDRKCRRRPEFPATTPAPPDPSLETLRFKSTFGLGPCNPLFRLDFTVSYLNYPCLCGWL